MRIHRLRALRATAGTATAALALCVGLSTLPTATALADLPPSFAPLVDQVKGAVVNIAATEVEEVASNDDGESSGRAQQMPPGMQEFMRRFGGGGGGMRQMHPGQMKV